MAREGSAGNRGALLASKGVAAEMIEKALLPVRLGNSKLQQSLANRVAQRLNPTGQGNPIQRKGSKEMHVIGHDDKSTNSDIVVLRLDKKCSKCLMGSHRGPAGDDVYMY